MVARRLWRRELVAARQSVGTAGDGERDVEYIHRPGNFESGGLPGDPGTSPEMPDAIENINLFMYVEPKNGAAAYMEHYYIELPESTAYYEFQAIDVPKCTASFYAIVNAGSHYEWDALSTEDEVMALTTIATPSRDLYAGTLLDLELVQMKHSGVIDAGLVASKVDIMYNIGTAISNYNAKPAGQKEHGDCTSAKSFH